MVTAAHCPSPLAKMSTCSVALLLGLLLLLPSVSGRPLLEVNRRSNYVGLATLCQGHPRNCQLRPFSGSFARARRQNLRAMAKRLETLAPSIRGDDVDEETLILALASPDSFGDLARLDLPQRQ